VKRKYFVTAIIVIVAGILIYFLIGRKSNEEKAGQEFTVKRGDVTHFTEQTGIIKAQVGAIVKVGTRATGTLTYLKYQVGDSVKKGELIATIDDREILANIRNTDATIDSLKKYLEAKEAQYTYSKTKYERELSLLE